MNLPCPVDTSRWGEAIRQRIIWDNPPELGPKRRPLIHEQDVEFDAIFAERNPINRPAADACISGLLLWQDDLEQSHIVSQSLATPEGSYWHGIMHRREPDYSNAKYWFHRVGSHPVFARLATWADKYVADTELRDKLDLKTWSPDLFVDLCQEFAHNRPATQQTLKAIAAAEWHFLFDHCFELATTPH